MTASTAAPALTMIIALRGRHSDETNSSIVFDGTMRLPAARSAANFSVTAVVRLKIPTEKPLLSMLRTRFSPINRQADEADIAQISSGCHNREKG